jgi:hypothetical protein
MALGVLSTPFFVFLEHCLQSLGSLGMVAVLNGVDDDGSNHLIVGLTINVSQHEFNGGMVGLLDDVLDSVLHNF